MSRITKSPVNKRDLKLNYFLKEISVNPLEINPGVPKHSHNSILGITQKLIDIERKVWHRNHW